METTKTRRSLWILAVFLLLLFCLCLWLYRRSPAKPSGPEPARAEAVLAFLPSVSAGDATVRVMNAAAQRLFDEFQAEESKVSVLYWRAGIPPEGPSCAVEAVATADALRQTLDRAQRGGTLSTAFQFARTLSETDGGLYRRVVLLTDRAPADGEQSEEGPYDRQDTVLYGYANAASQSAAELSARDALSVVAFLQELSGQEFDFTRRFLNDIQTTGYYEVLNSGGLDTLSEKIAAELLKERGVQKLTFRYENGPDCSAICYYSDNYFAASPYEYNQSLATMSVCFSMSAFGSGDQTRYANKSVNARNLLKSIGVAEDAIDTNQWFRLRPETDSIGVVSGNKPITVNGETYTLIPVAVRGGGYGREWASNFTIGETGQHDGFDTAKNHILDYLTSYIRKQNITGPVKFWVTGFSRAAAVANLLAGALDQGYDFGAEITYGPEDVYAYCFEPPAGALSEQTRNQAVYYNIFNIINQSDPVPFVAPSGMGFGRYGMDRYLPSAQSSSNYLTERAAMLRIYRAMGDADSYSVDNFRMQKLGFGNLLSGEKSVLEEDTKNNYSQGVYLSNYVAMLTKEFIKDRRNYVEQYQDGIREVCSVMFGISDEDQKVIFQSLQRQFTEHWPEVVSAYFNPLTPNDEAFSIVSDWIVTAVDEAGVTDYDEPVLRGAGAALSELLVNVLVRHPNDAATLMVNLPGIVESHAVRLCFAWMMSMDENYRRGAELSFNQGNYRIVRVNCDVDVSVRDENGEIVAQIVNESPQDIRGSSIISAINENGEKIVILPADTAYQVSVTRREADPDSANLLDASETPDLVNISIDEFSAQATDVTRNVDYLNVRLEEGETLESVLPAVPEADAAAYTLSGPDGNVIKTASDLSGEAASDTLYTVTAAPDNDTAGAVFGGGTARYGDFVQLEAVPRDGYAFSGWYAGPDTLLSAEAVYRFCVTRDVALTARFAEEKPVTDFPDVPPRSYCYDAVRWAVETGVASGTSDTTFSPKEPCTAAQAVTFLWRAAGSPEPASGRSPFTDLDSNAYYYKAVLWAAERDITMGATESAFSPDKTVSRSQFITLLYRAFATEQMEGFPFTDVPADAYYRDAVAWAYGKGVTRGMTSTTFEPLRSCNRGQIVTFLYRYFHR